MSYVTREQISEALFNLLKSATFTYTQGITSFQTTSRRFRSFDQCVNCQQPALFLVEHKETATRGDNITPVVRRFLYDAYIFINIGNDPTLTPMTYLNNIIDSIDDAAGGVMLGDAMTNRQTLGGLVWDCYIDGEIDKVPGDIDGNGLAIIPIKAVIP